MSILVHLVRIDGYKWRATPCIHTSKRGDVIKQDALREMI